MLSQHYGILLTRLDRQEAAIIAIEYGIRYADVQRKEDPQTWMPAPSLRMLQERQSFVVSASLKLREPLQDSTCLVFRFLLSLSPPL